MCGAGLFLMELAKNGHFTGNSAVKIFLHLLCDTDTIKSISRRMEAKTVIEGSERRRNEKSKSTQHGKQGISQTGMQICKANTVCEPDGTDAQRGQTVWIQALQML